MTGSSRMSSGLLTRSVISEEDTMELTDSETGEQKYLLDHIKAMHID